MTNPVLNIANVAGLALLVGMCWREVGDFLKRHIFRLAERIPWAHVWRAFASGGPVSPRDPPPLAEVLKEEPMQNHNATVAQLLGSATGAVEAMTDCGVLTDDTELVADLINALDEGYASVCKAVDLTRQQLMDQGLPADALAERHDTIRLSLGASRVTTSLWVLWRTAHVLKKQASADVLEAAREVSKAGAEWQKGQPRYDHVPQLERALAKLAASLPKED